MSKQHTLIQGQQSAMAPKRMSAVKKKQEPLIGDSQYNRLLSAIQHSIACDNFYQTAKEYQQEEAEKNVVDASKDTVAALNAFIRRPKTAAQTPVDDLNDEQRHQTRRLYADIVADIRRRQEDPSSKAAKIAALPDFARAFGLKLENDQGETDGESDGWFPTKYTKIGEDGSKSYSCHDSLRHD